MDEIWPEEQHVTENKYHQAQKEEKASFFRRRYEELCSSNHGMSGLELKRFIEAEYYQAQAKAEAERQAQAKAKAERQTRAKMEAERSAQAKAEEMRQAQIRAKERAEYKRKAIEKFEALGKEMAETKNRAKIAELTRRRVELAQRASLPLRDSYKSYCWNCGEAIFSRTHAQCSECTYYICVCGECICNYPGRGTDIW